MKHIVVDPPLTETEKLARQYYLKGRQEGKERKRFARPVWLRLGWWALAKRAVKAIGHTQVDAFEYDNNFKDFTRR